MLDSFAVPHILMDCSDYMHPTTIPVKGETFEKFRTTTALLRLLINVAFHDDDVDATLLDVRGFVAPATDLLRPSVIAKMLLVWLKQKLC